MTHLKLMVVGTPLKSGKSLSHKKINFTIYIIILLVSDL